jgi:hypothetical protein
MGDVLKQITTSSINVYFTHRIWGIEGPGQFVKVL